MEKSDKKSDFGRGLVICLVKFAEHFENRLSCRFGDSPIGMRYDVWANGASDHLYEIEVPEGKEWDAIRKKVLALQSKGLRMGHGFTGKEYSDEDFSELVSITHDIAMMIDKKLGLKPGLGVW